MRWVIVENDLLLRKLAADSLARYTLIVLLAAPGANAPGSNMVSLAELESEGSADGSLPELSPSAAATLIYTSGTTGQPKGIMYRHEQVVLAVRAILSAYPSLPVEWRFVCWLPLSNLFQRILNITGMYSGATAFLVADPMRVMEMLPHARPEIFIGVPRFY